MITKIKNLKNRQHLNINYKSCLKIDYDMPNKIKMINTLSERLLFLADIGFIDLKDILYIFAVRKNTYSARIYLARELKDPLNIIIFQAILGDDYKRVGVVYRDYLINIENFNRLFDWKQYSDNSTRQALYTNITERVLLHIDYLKQRKN